MSRDAFANAVGDLMASWNLSHATGRVYGILLIEQESVSLDAIAEALALSKGQVSTSVRELVAWGLARTIPQPGSRRLLVEAEGGLESLLDASHRRARALLKVLDSGRELVPENTKASSRLGDVIDLFDGYVAAGEQIVAGRAKR